MADIDTQAGLDFLAPFEALKRGETFIAPPVTLTPLPGGGLATNLRAVSDAITSAVGNYYGTKSQIYAMQAQARATKAAGQNTVEVARAGLPSPTLLVAGGFGLLALFILSGRR